MDDELHRDTGRESIEKSVGFLMDNGSLVLFISGNALLLEKYIARRSSPVSK